MPITNTLENAKKLEALGVTVSLARGIAEIVVEAIQANNQDLKVFFREEMERQFSQFRAEMKAEISALRGELKAEISALRGETKTESTALRGELKAEIAQTRADLQRQMRQQLLWFFTMAASIATISVAIIKLFPNAP